jgi:thiol-disulfide isomerase/thioredoxin
MAGFGKYARLVPALALIMASPASAQVPPGSILLFWASWCAPCRAEVINIANLQRAAGDMRVIIVPVEPRSSWRGLLRSLRPDQLLVPRGGGLALMQRLAGPQAALPVAIAIDANGRVCASQRRGLTVERASEWQRLCQ